MGHLKKEEQQTAVHKNRLVLKKPYYTDNVTVSCSTGTYVHTNNSPKRQQTTTVSPMAPNNTSSAKRRIIFTPIESKDSNSTTRACKTFHADPN